MVEDFYNKLLARWCDKLPEEQKIIHVFEKVRDIPYGSVGARDPFHIIESNLGSCSGKHILLNDLFRVLGYNSKVKTCLEHFQKSLPPNNNYPSRLQKIINNYQIIDFHHFVSVERGGRWISVDATWDLPLEKYGFNINRGWDGNSDTILAVEPISFFPDTEDIIGLKERLVAEMDPFARELRAEFLALLTDWLRIIRR